MRAFFRTFSAFIRLSWLCGTPLFCLIAGLLFLWFTDQMQDILIGINDQWRQIMYMYFSLFCWAFLGWFSSYKIIQLFLQSPAGYKLKYVPRRIIDLFPCFVGSLCFPLTALAIFRTLSVFRSSEMFNFVFWFFPPFIIAAYAISIYLLWNRFFDRRARIKPLTIRQVNRLTRQVNNLLLIFADYSLLIFLFGRSIERGDTRIDFLFLLIFGIFLLSTYFIAFVILRRVIMDYISEVDSRSLTILAYRFLDQYEHRYSQSRPRFNNPYWALGGLVAALYLTSVLWPAFANELGSLSVMFLAFSCFIFLGKFITAFAIREENLYLFPFVFGSLIIGLSPLNNNHTVRTLPPKLSGSTAVPPPQTLMTHFRSWLEDAPRRAHIQRWLATHPGESFPVYLALSHGGGVRAAYWSAALLAVLEDLPDSDLSMHLYAISGASGGNLGSGIYTALLRQRLRQGTPDRPIRPRVRAFMRHDFLTPTMAALLGPDLFQRLFPLGFLSRDLPDRAVALECAWERAYDDVVVGPNDFARSFDQLWRYHPYRLPALFINATRMEDGSRCIYSNVALDSQSFPGAHDVRVALDAPVRLSTAIGFSARYPLITPGGHIPDFGHVVDGGYFDNAGAFTVFNIYTALQRWLNRPEAQEDPLLSKLEIHIISLENYPIHPGSSNVEPYLWGNDLFAPFYTAYHAPHAHTLSYLELLKTTIALNNPGDVGQNTRFISLNIRDCQPRERPREEVVVPLGWYLSEKALRYLDRQINLIQETPNFLSLAERIRIPPDSLPPRIQPPGPVISEE